MKRVTYILITFFCLLVYSCKDSGLEDGGTPMPDEATAYKLAIVASKESRQDHERTVTYALQMIDEAQRGLARGIKLNIEWVDDALLETEAARLLKDEQIPIIIDLEGSERVEALASQMRNKGKLLISPIATSAELHHKYAGKNFFWPLCDTDITQCELLLDHAKVNQAKSVALMAPTDTYGQTFWQWFAFFATEMKLTVEDIFPPSEVEEAVRCHADYLICVPGKKEDVARYMQAAKLVPEGQRPQLVFSDLAFDESVLKYGDLVEGMHGLSPFTEPEFGFLADFWDAFHCEPTMHDVMLYDAMALSAIVITEYDRRRHDTPLAIDPIRELENIMQKVVEPGDKTDNRPRLNVCKTEGLHYAMQSIGTPLQGASGNLDIDVSRHNATYCHWGVTKGEFHTNEYFTSPEMPGEGDWAWSPTMMEELQDVDVEHDYGKIGSQWAVLICGSKGWNNYRHEADVLNVYQLLKENGYPDDHIILIGNPGEILNNARNTKHDIHAIVGGPNLYADVELDYCTDTLNATDISDILLGQSSSHLPRVLQTDEHSNIVFYWSGHGHEDSFDWGDDEIRGLSREVLKKVLVRMEDEHRYRQILFMGEPCCSAFTFRAMEGRQGMLGIASAEDHESSLVDIYDDDLKVWISDRFSNVLVGLLRHNRSMTFRDFYLGLFRSTYGSHVTLVNKELFDNLYHVTLDDFIRYKTLNTN